ALGLVSVTLNTAVDVVVVLMAARARSLALARPSLLRRLRLGTGLAVAGLGLSLLFARRPAAALSSKIAPARVQPAEAPRILCGKQAMVKPSPGSASRLCSFSRWQ